MDLSIIIVSWNTKDLLKDCLHSLSNNLAVLNDRQVETFVVDNASADGTSEMVRDQFSWVKLIENDENKGFAGANNQAFSQCIGLFILLLNPDTELRPNALSTLLDFVEANPNAGAAGARLLNSDGSLQQSCYRAPTPGRELWLLFHLDKLFPGYVSYNMTAWDTTAPRPVDVLKGACILLRMEVIGREQLFDEAYFMYSEEVDLCHHIQRSGQALYWVPQAEVVHHEGQSTRQAAASMFLHLYRAKLLYFRKNGGRWTARFYKGVLFMATLTRLSLSPLAWLERPPARRRHLALASRYWQLLRVLPGM
ncbi:MAG: glycosyltransferase family 2 protein [Candidatus Promineifilaceae bacterium]